MNERIQTVSIISSHNKASLGGLMNSIAGILIAGFALGAPLAQAQSMSPVELELPADEFPAVPDIDRQVGSQGVDVVSGRFTTQSPVISIGDPAAGGLSYQLLYDGTGMRHSVTGGVAQVGSNTVLVAFMGGAEEFTFTAGAYAPSRPSGSTLSYAAGLYTYQTGDGSIIEFRAVPAYVGAVYGYDLAYVERFRAPNGQELSYTYALGVTDYGYYQTPGGELCLPDDAGSGDCQLNTQTENFLRLQSVSSNQGYLLHFEYELDLLGPSYFQAGDLRIAADQWQQLNKVQAINLADVWCAPTAFQCAVGSQWPHLEFERVQNALLDPTEFTIRDALDHETVWSFDTDGRLAEIEWLDASGAHRLASKTISYDAEDRVSAISQGGLSWTTSRTETSRLPSNDPFQAAISTLEVVSTAPDGTSTTSYVDRSISRVYEVLDAAGKRTFIQHDSHRRPQRVTYPEGNAVEYAYDARGNVTTVTQIAKPGSGLADLVTSFVYPATCDNRLTCNQPISVTTPDGGVTSYQYFPAHGGVDRITAPSVNGAALVTRVVYSAQTARYHTGAGQISNAATSIILPERTRACMLGGGCAGQAHERVTRFVYGAQGQPNNLQVSDIYEETGDGSESLHTRISYNAFGDVVSVDGPAPGGFDAAYLAYDALRRQTHMAGADPDGAGPLPRQAMRMVYDAAGRVEERHSGTVTGGSGTPNWSSFAVTTSQSMEYDALGRPTAARNLTATGGVEGLLQYAYDAGGRLSCTAQRLNPSAFGAPPSSACTLGSGGVLGSDRIQRLNYDSAGRVNSVTDALSQAVVSYAYTDNGLQESLTDGNGNTTLYSYDGYDRVTRIDYAFDETVSEFETFSYNAVGRLSARTNRGGQSFSYGYDALGRVAQVNTPAGADTVTYTYNVFNQITSVTSGGETLTNAYNALGWLLSQTGPQGTVSYQYDAAGRRERLTWPGSDNFYVTYAYDHASRLEEIREMGGTSGLAVLAHYDYDAQGRLESILRGNGVRTGFNYDAASRLDELATELTGATPSQIRTLGFDYNPAGQITERTDTGGNFAFSGHTDQTTVYDHNALNQIIDITETGAVTRTLTPQWTDGNLTSDGERSFGYDPFNRLTSVTGGGQSDVDLDYDPLGRLAELDVTGGLVTRFQYDGAAMIAETDGAGDVMRRYVHGPGMDAPLVRYDYTSAGALEGRRWLLADERGSIYAHADEAGAIIQINTYDEYGRPGNSNQGRFGYTGQIWLAEAGLYHYKARAYHAELGVFMQTDPIGHSGGINLYAYVGGDPVNFTDPWGLKPRYKCTMSTGSNWDCVRNQTQEEKQFIIDMLTRQQGVPNPGGSFDQFARNSGRALEPLNEIDDEVLERLCAAARALENGGAFQQALGDARDAGTEGFLVASVGTQGAWGLGGGAGYGVWVDLGSRASGQFVYAQVSVGVEADPIALQIGVSSSRPGGGSVEAQFGGFGGDVGGSIPFTGVDGLNGGMMLGAGGSMPTASFSLTGVKGLNCD